MMTRLVDRVAIVTGGGGGIGAAVARRLVAEGARVVVADLFEADATLDIAGLGQWKGAKSIRRGLEREGPAGLPAGELNEHVQFPVS